MMDTSNISIKITNLLRMLFPIILSIIAATIFARLISSLIKNGKAFKIARERTDKANQEEKSRVIKDAEYKTSGLIGDYNSSTKIEKEIPNCLKEASLWLQIAEKEYQANAFDPFWNAVEEAAIWLGDYDYKVKQLAKNANEYYRKLNGEKHNFPIFPVRLESIPDASYVIKELHRINRLGQTNFHFANIYQHRRTRKAIVAGFQTLHDAINNLGNTIENSISELQYSISSDMAKVVKEQIRTRESIDSRLLEQNRMLDNIQHGREPELRDIPTKY